METLQATISAPTPTTIAQMRDSETTRSAFIPANSRVREAHAHDDLPEGRATEHRPSSSAATYAFPLSLPNSQDSNYSFSSLASGAVPRFQASSSNLSQNTDVTIPSSVASFDHPIQGESQENMARFDQSSQISSADWRPAPAGIPITSPVDTNVHKGAPMKDASPTSPTAPASIGGTKRTSSGMMKRPDSSHSLAPSWHGDHSSTNRIESSGSRTGGLAADLKTKLTYAMLKVNNGWQQNNINQIERLTSQKASPTSATFSENISRRACASPHFASPNMARRVSGGSSDSDSYLTSPITSTFTPINGSTARFSTKASSPPQIKSWSSRSFPQNPYGKPTGASGVIAAHSNLAAATSKPILAPPADISPPRSRRVDSSVLRPPSLPANHRREHPNSKAPHTPNQNPRATLIRTPTEQAKAEKDALDTLMFMSSPGNSTHYAHPSQGSRGQPSPLRLEPRRAAGQDGVHFVRTPGKSTSSSSAGASPGSHIRNYAQVRKPQGDVARILDEMEEEESEKEEGAVRSAIRA